MTDSPTASAAGPQTPHPPKSVLHYLSKQMPRFRSFRWRITVQFFLLTAALLAALSFIALYQFNQYQASQALESLTTHAQLLSSDAQLRQGLAESRWQAGDRELARQAIAWSEQLDARVTVSLTDGRVLADSHANPLTMTGVAQQPEFRAALAEGTGYTIRRSRTLGSEMIYAAAAVPPFSVEPADGDGMELDRVVGVLRLSVPSSDGAIAPNRLRRTILLATLLALAIAGGAAYFVAQRMARPFRDLARVAAGLAQRELGIRLEPRVSDEAGQLSRVFIRLSERLRSQVATVSRVRERLNSVLDNLVDGVFILDSEGRVRLCNLVAAHMVGSDGVGEAHSQADVEHETPGTTNETAPRPTEAGSPQLHGRRQGFRGLPFAQIVKDHRIVETWQDCRNDGRQAENIFQWGNRTLRVIALPFAAGGSDGYIVLLQDMTKVHRLERIRRDFVSNISHELRTPLASLQALTETLRDGAIDDPDAAPHFLDRIETEVDSLAQMVRELLELSRIESGQVPFRFRPVPVSETVLTPVERLQPLAARSQIDLIVDLPHRLPHVYADAERIHQVITNLVHNALKFSSEGGSVRISAVADPDSRRVTISVNDTGIGVPFEDTDRIFERFYKTDRARAGGGTGLGLAIAKHIVQAHNGRIWVDSIENRGSTFSFTLSAAANGDQGPFVT